MAAHNTQSQIAEFDELPDWAQGYNEAVVRTAALHGSHMHRPDLSADEPAPRCGDGRGTDYVVKERSVIESHYKMCTRPQCFGGQE